MAGKAGAHYIENGEEKNLAYEELFTADRWLRYPEIGYLSWYPNRDSLSYTSLYGLQDTKHLSAPHSGILILCMAGKISLI